jgi:3-(3-hydroxy-phenyl)propionate hydroxylase
MREPLPSSLEGLVAIVGAGPVGLTLANLLGRRGVRTLVLERATQPCDTPRAVGVDADCLRVWQAAGLVDEMLPDMNGMGAGGLGMVYVDPDGEPFLEVRPQRREQGFPFGCGIVQPLVDGVLRAGLERFPCVDLRLGVEIDGVVAKPDSVVLRGRTSEGERVELEVAWAVACDGGRSALRRALGIPMAGRSARERWLVVDALVNEPEPAPREPGDVTIRCDADRPSVCVPRRAGHRRFEFMLRPQESEAQMLRAEALRELLAAYVDPDAVRVLRRLVHRFQSRVAQRYRVGRVLLCGDAAHLTPPFAAQGLALGVRDAMNLAWKLAFVAQGRADPALVDSYEPERRPDALACLRLAHGLGWLMTPRSRLRAALVPRLLRAACRHRALREFLREGGPKPAARLRDGLLLRAARGSVVGRRLPQPRVVGADGRECRLDDLLGDDFSLLAFAPLPGAPGPRAQAALRALGATSLVLRPPGAVAACGEATDPDGALAAWLGDTRERVLVVRPDRFVAADLRVRQLDAALPSLASLLVGASGTKPP